jgi:PAS domain S-box-containing protein
MMAFLRRVTPTIRSLRIAIAVSIVLPVLIFVAVAWTDRARLERGAETTIRKTIAMLHEHCLEILKTDELVSAQIDQRIQGLDWDAIGRSEELRRFLQDLNGSLRQIGMMSLIDPGGHRRNGSRASPDEPAEDDNLSELRKPGVATFVGVSGTDRTAGTRTFEFARRRSAPEDRFDGIIEILADPQYFADFFRSFITSRDDSIALIRADGEMLLRGPQPISARTTLASDTGFMRAIAGADDGLYAASSELDDVDRMAGFAKLADYPLYITFGISKQAIRDQWYADLAEYGIVAALSAAALSAMSWVHFWRIAALRRSEARYRTLYSHTPVSMHTLDPEGRILTVSDDWIEMMGYARIEVIGRHIVEFHTAKSAQQFHKEIWPRMLARGGLRQVEREYVTKHGAIIQALLSARTETDASGQVTCVHAVIVDITPLKRAEQDLRREKELSGFLLKSSTEGIIGIDREYRITLWNPAMESLTGETPQAALGQNIFELFPTDRGTGIEAAWQSALEGKATDLQDRSYVVPRTRQRGFYEARYAPIYGEDGEILGGVAFLRDTTQRHDMEEILRQSQKMEALGQLTGGIAHDFNNLLTAIIGNLQLVEDKLRDDQPQLKRQITGAQRAADRGARLTSQLLAFSRRQALHPETCDLNELIRDFQNLTQRAAGEAVVMLFQFQDGLWSCRVDPSQFEAAVLNLVVNARDAIVTSGTVTIDTANIVLPAANSLGVPSGDYVRFSISDTGTGMSPQVLARASEPFFTTKDVGKGTGLGLSMVYGFVHQSGGGMRIVSEQGVGTRIDMYLPRSTDDLQDSAAETPAAVALSGSGRILVVDDDADVLGTVAATLSEIGYEVIGVPNSAAALEILHTGKIVDLLFSDIVMTGMSGVDLARAVRQEFPEVKILLASGFPSRGSKTVALAEEFPFITKPYRREVLANLIGGLLAGNTRETAAPAPRAAGHPSEAASDG